MFPYVKGQVVNKSVWLAKIKENLFCHIFYSQHNPQLEMEDEATRPFPTRNFSTIEFTSVEWNV